MDETKPKKNKPRPKKEKGSEEYTSTYKKCHQCHLALTSSSTRCVCGCPTVHTIRNAWVLDEDEDMEYFSRISLFYDWTCQSCQKTVSAYSDHCPFCRKLEKYKEKQKKDLPGGEDK